MKYNFDKIIDRHHTDAIKIERIHEVLKRDDVIPMWIADMDFATPDFILDVIKQRFESSDTQNATKIGIKPSSNGKKIDSDGMWNMSG